ncbi:MAG: S-adenosylmethionine decarboxylase family protein [Agriterribacter sp.]
MPYQPGTHLIATLQTPNSDGIMHCQAFMQQLNLLIQQYSLQKLGEVYHDFVPGGFTAVVCLSESHISVHTWPEHALINLDIYLSNFQRNNDGTVHAIFNAIVKHFDATIVNHQIIIR